MGEDILPSRSIPYLPLTYGSLSRLAPRLGESGADVQEIVDFLTSGNTSGNSIGGAVGDAAESGGDDVGIGLGAAALIGLFQAGSSIFGSKMASNAAIRLVCSRLRIEKQPHDFVKTSDLIVSNMPSARNA